VWWRYTLLATEYHAGDWGYGFCRPFVAQARAEMGLLPLRYSAGIFVFPPNASMPLHDHSKMIVFSRVLYDFDGDFDQMDVDRDAVVDDDDRDNGDARRPLSVLRTSFKIIKEYY